MRGVVAVAEEHRVVAAVPVDAVVLIPAEEDVGAVSAVQRVDPVAAVQRQLDESGKADAPGERVAPAEGRLDPYPKRRGFAQLKELLRAGVDVSLGNDVIMDPWYQLGKADLVHAANLALHFTYMSGLDEIPEMLACATWRGAKTLDVEDEYGIEEGKPAHLVVFDAPTPVEVLRLQPVRRWVIRSGRVVAETTPPSTRLFHRAARRRSRFRRRLLARDGRDARSPRAGCSSPPRSAAGRLRARSGT